MDYTQNDKPVIDMNGYTYFMGHVINGAVPGVVCMVGAATYHALFVAKQIMPGSLYGMGLQTNAAEEERKDPVQRPIPPVPNVISTRSSRSPSGDRNISPRPPPIQT
jgi:hypothetical protein